MLRKFRGFFPSCGFQGSTPFFGGEVGVLWWFEWDFFVFPFSTTPVEIKVTSYIISSSS